MFKGINNQYDFKKSTQAMDQLVTDAHVIWIRTHLIHWIMQNDRTSQADFLIAHDWYDKPLDWFVDFIDDVAERMVQLNGVPTATLQALLDNTNIKEEQFNYQQYTLDQLIQFTINDFKTFRDEISDSIDILNNDGDVSDSNKLQDYLSDINKFIWFLTATLGQNTLDNSNH